MWVKICGLTTIEDAQAAAAAGADAVGFVFAESPRQVSIDAARAISHALPPFVTRVGVFVEPTYDEAMRAVEGARLHVVQVHGDVEASTIERLRELGCDVMQAVAMRDEAAAEAALSTVADALLLDAYVPGKAGGTGQTFDWRLAADVVRGLQQNGRHVPVVLAGGLTPANVADAVRAVRPWAVDVSSGVELEPGRKCPQKMREFVRKVREANGSTDDAVR